MISVFDTSESFLSSVTFTEYHIVSFCWPFCSASYFPTNITDLETVLCIRISFPYTCFLWLHRWIIIPHICQFSTAMFYNIYMNGFQLWAVFWYRQSRIIWISNRCNRPICRWLMSKTHTVRFNKNVKIILNTKIEILMTKTFCVSIFEVNLLYWEWESRSNYSFNRLPYWEICSRYKKVYHNEHNTLYIRIYLKWLALAAVTIQVN